jgi:hypothetical protein
MHDAKHMHSAKEMTRQTDALTGMTRTIHDVIRLNVRRIRDNLRDASATGRLPPIGAHSGGYLAGCQAASGVECNVGSSGRPAQG